MSMFAQVDSSLESFSVFEMVQRLYPGVDVDPQIIGEPRELYLAIEQTIESGESLGPKEVFSRVNNPNISYHSFQKRLQKVNKELDTVLNPYVEQYVHSPQLANFLRSELIRFGCYLSSTVNFKTSTPVSAQVSLYSDVDVVSLRATNQSLQHETASLKEEIETLKAQLETLSERPSSNADIKNNEALFHELFSIHDTVKSQRDALSSVADSHKSYSIQHDSMLAELHVHLDDRFSSMEDKIAQSSDKSAIQTSIDCVSEQISHLPNSESVTQSFSTMVKKFDVTKELSDIHELAKTQYNAITTLTSETAERTENHQMLVVTIKEELDVRLGGMEKSIIASTSQTKLLTAIDEIDSHVSKLVTQSKLPQPLVEIQKSHVSIDAQLNELTSNIGKLQSMSPLEPNTVVASSFNSDFLAAIDEKISRLGSQDIADVDVERLNKAFEYICQLVKQVIAQNKDFEERSIVPVENISHLVKSNEALTTKIEKLSEEKRDAVKQLSNMIKATSNSTLHKTSFTNTATVTELKSKLTKSEANLMKSREELASSKRQVEAKDKKIQRLSPAVAV